MWPLVDLHEFTIERKSWIAIAMAFKIARIGLLASSSFPRSPTDEVIRQNRQSRHIRANRGLRSLQADGSGSRNTIDVRNVTWK